MIQLEKAKIINIDKYEEALKRAKEFIGKEECINLEYIFPELRESEDEKIICSLKEIVTYAFSKKENEVLVSINGLKKDDLITWLEKQGEQKVSYTTIVETGDGGINALVTRELPTDDEQKPAEWSEDDEWMLNEAINAVTVSDYAEGRKEMCIDWLKSLKDRIRFKKLK